MTELEKRKKALENAKKKYPDVSDTAQLEKLSISLERKNTIIKTIAMIIGGAISVIISFFISLESVAQIFIIMGGVFIIDGFLLLFSLFKKKKVIHIDESKKTVINMAYLKSKDKKDNFSTILKQVIGMGIAVAVLYGRSDTTVFLLFTLVPLAFIGLYWIFRIRRCRINQKSILEESFKILKTKLYDKEDETDVGTDAETTHTYYLIFKYQGRWNYRFKEIVKRKEFNKRQLGDECYLLLFLSDKKDEYKIENIFWVNETSLSDELKNFIATDEEIAQKNRYGTMEYAKLRDKA